MLYIKNDGPTITETNYWHGEYSQRGFLFFSVNEGAVRMLIPDTASLDLLPAIRKAEYVIISRCGDKYEVLFEDHTDTPYIIHTESKSWDRLIAYTDHNREDITFTAYTNGLTLLRRMPGKFRMVTSIPYMKPWSIALQKQPSTPSTPPHAKSAASAIESVLGTMNDWNKHYHSTLASELAQWYCYPRDGGHSIMCILKKDFSNTKTKERLIRHMVPVPVKSVLKRYEVRNSVVIVDLPYSQLVGVIIPAEDYEW